MIERGLKIADFGIRTVKDINIELAPGQAIGLTGPSGAGKTLFLRALADLDPHYGKMSLDGVAAEAIAVNLWRRNVGLLSAESAWWHDTVRPHFTTVDMSWLTALGFGPEALDWQVARLSSGERQKLALLRLLMCRPKVLLLDEPTANLDPDNIGRVENLLARYRQNCRPGMVWVSHDLEQLKRNCSRIYSIRNGHMMPESALPGQGLEA